MIRSLVAFASGVGLILVGLAWYDDNLFVGAILMAAGAALIIDLIPR